MSRIHMPIAPASKVAPFIPGEDHQDRHWRRLEIALGMVDEARRQLAEMGLSLKVSADGGQHWQVVDATGRVAEWWPQTGRFVLLGNYRRPQKFHDVPGFLIGVRRRKAAAPQAKPTAAVPEMIAVPGGYVRHEAGWWVALDRVGHELGRERRKQPAVSLCEQAAR